MRIAVGQVWQETNTFNPIATTRGDFERMGVLRGSAVVEQMADTNELGGFIQSLRRWREKPEIVGLVRLPAWPGGTATLETFQWIRQELLDSLTQEMPVDGVLLALHGAMVAHEHPDVEGELLSAIREAIGPNVPLVATLDLHANVTQQMVTESDALVLYHTVPHLDVFETGARGVEVLRRILLEDAQPVTVFQKIPMVVPPQRNDTHDQSSIGFFVKERLQALERVPGILSAGVAPVQPWLDIPDLGSSVVIVADKSAEQWAESECRRLAAEIWNRRTDYLPNMLSVEEAVKMANGHSEGLVVLSDGADATTSGSPGDNNAVLCELLRYRWARPALVTLVSPEVVAEARRLGCTGVMPARSECTWRLGGIRDTRFAKPISVPALVRCLFDARFVLSGHLGNHLPIDMGPAAVLQHSQNIQIVVTSASGPHFAPELFQAAGIDPFSASVLVAKSPCGFRAAYQERAKAILLVRSPGCAPDNFWNYEYHRIPRPLWPWDETNDWTPSPGFFLSSPNASPKPV